MRTIKVKNNDTSSHIWGGKDYTASEEHVLDDEAEVLFYRKDTTFFNDLGGESPKASISNGDSYYSDATIAWEYLNGGVITARTINCQTGRKLHDRYITFTTADQDNYDNTDWQENDYGDVTYTMKDVDGATTTVDADCKETWISFEPTWDYEVAGGGLFIPDTLSGDDNAWEVHAVGVPDIPASYGGNVHFIANPRIKWLKGGWLFVDASNNPANMVYDATNHTNKIMFVVKHPVGAQIEFQLNLKVYR